MNRSKQILIGLALLFLTACGTPSAFVPPTVEPRRPDPSWTATVTEPQPLGRTNADLADWALALKAALAKANEQLDAIARWAEEK